MTIAGYKKAIAKLLKAYHKKWDWQGKPISKKKSKKEIEKELVGLVNGTFCSSSYNSSYSCCNNRNS